MEPPNELEEKFSRREKEFNRNGRELLGKSAFQTKSNEKIKNLRDNFVECVYTEFFFFFFICQPLVMPPI